MGVQEMMKLYYGEFSLVDFLCVLVGGRGYLM